MFAPCLLFFAVLPTIDNVYIRHHGPYRFVVDTGAQTSVIDVTLAASLNLVPEYRVEVVTPTGSSLATARQDHLIAQGKQFPSSELLFLPLGGTPGILGQSALERVDYLIDLKRGTVEIDPATRISGLTIPLRYDNHRIVIPASVRGKRTDFLLDSGANAVVLAEAAFPIGGQFDVRTHNGQSTAAAGRVNLKIEILSWRSLPAATIPGGPNLLPASLFRRIYVSNRDGILVLEK